MAACLTIDEIELHARGGTDPATRSRCEQHLAGCRRCRSVYAQLAKRDNSSVGTPPALEETVATPLHRANPSLDETASAGSWTLDAGAPRPGPRRAYLPNIEGYKIERVIGHGGMGVVYEATQLKLGRRVALKLLPAMVGARDPQLVKRFQREATAAARLHHTNIVPVYDYGESPDGYYYAMELIHGEPLSDVVKRIASRDQPMSDDVSVALRVDADRPVAADADLPPPEHQEVLLLKPSGTPGAMPYYRQVAEWFVRLAEALHYAHQEGMIHRDIKPSNVMLCSDGRPIILDFGLVKSVGDETVTESGSVVGTYRYMSPEQITGGTEPVDARSDQYSLGATLYELLTLQPAFPAIEQQELLNQIVNRDPTAPRKVIPSVPAKLETICLKAMEKSRGARYPSLGAMAEDLRRYLSDAPLVARSPGPVGRAIKWTKRHPAVAMTVGAMTLLTLAVTFGVWQRETARHLRIQSLVRDGVAAMQAKNFMEATGKFNAALALDPDNFAVLVNFAISRKDEFYRARDPALLDEADELLERALRVEPNRAEIWNLRGVILRTGGKLAEAVEAHHQALRLDNKYLATWVNLGAVYAMQGNLLAAEHALLKGTTASESNVGPNPWHNLAVVQLQLGRSEAADSVQRALDQPWRVGEDLWRPACFLLKARLHLDQPGYRDSRQALRSAITADELTGAAQRRQEKSDSELALLGRIKRTLSHALLQNGMYQDSITAAEAAAAYGDPPTFSYLLRAVAAAQLGDVNRARSWRHQVLVNWPAELESRQFITSVRDGILWIDTWGEFETLMNEVNELTSKQAPERATP